MVRPAKSAHQGGPAHFAPGAARFAHREGKTGNQGWRLHKPLEFGFCKFRTDIYLS
jgi:hypothetical protein